MRPLRILHLISQRPDSTGSGIYIQAMIREAARRGHTNFLLAGISGNEVLHLADISPQNNIFVRFDGIDLPFPIVGMSDVMPYPSYRFCDLNKSQLDHYKNKFAEKIHTTIQTFRPDIIHSHHLWVVTSLARTCEPRLPIVASCHGSDLRQFQACPTIGKKIVAHCRNLNRVLALSKIQKSEIETLYKILSDKITITGAGYNQELFYFSRKPIPQPVQIVYAGKLSRSKGVVWLLKALHKIKQTSWFLHLIGGGDGPEKEECYQLAGRLGNRIKIYGPVNQIELANILKQSHLFVLPSLFEGLPLVVLEALACGCRVLVTALPGVLEIFDTRKSPYVQLVDLPRLKGIDEICKKDEKRFVEDLTNTISTQINLIKRYPTLHPQRIEKKIQEFSWARVFERVERIYDEVADPL